MKPDDHSFTFQLPARLTTWLRPLCDPAWGMGTTRRFLILATMAAVWFVIVLTTVWHHEFWRDEVRALSIAIASPSIWRLPEFLKNEGHPVVWYVLLRIGYQALRSYSVLPALSMLVAGAAVMIFLLRSPFSLGLKFLFVFSILPLYEYSVMARNYGISMLLMFGFAAAYPHRRRHPFVLAALLALLANTNVHSLLVAGVLTALWLWDEAVVDRQSLSTRQMTLLCLAAALTIAATLFAVTTVLPDKRTIVTSTFHASNYLKPIVLTLIKPWKTMELLLPMPASSLFQWPGRLLQTLLIGALVLGLTVRIRLAYGLLIAFLMFGFVFNVVYRAELRHQGILLIFALVLFWLNAEQGQSFRGSLLARLNSLALIIVLPIVLLWCDYLAVNAVRKDIHSDLSSCKALGEWLNNRPEYKDAIILGEPDYKLESLPYYSAQKIYIPRESRFGNWVRFTTEARPVMTLGELLDTAQGLKEKEHQTIFVALGFPASRFEQKGPVDYSYNKTLVWTSSDWQRFGQCTKKMADFWSSVGDENFTLYEIR